MQKNARNDILNTLYTDRMLNRSYHIIAADVISIISTTVLLLLPSTTASYHLGHYILTCILVAAIYAHVAVVITWMINNL